MILQAAAEQWYSPLIEDRCWCISGRERWHQHRLLHLTPFALLPSVAAPRPAFARAFQEAGHTRTIKQPLLWLILFFSCCPCGRIVKHWSSKNVLQLSRFYSLTSYETLESV